VLLVADEGRMRKLKSFTLRGVDLVEAVGVQLSHKRTKVVVFEVLGEDILLKRVGVPDGERGTILRPRHDVVGGVVSVLVVIAIIVLAGALVHRYRLVPRLRARLTNTPYEDIVISDRQNVVTSMSGLA